jgi:hypothetical protein
MTKKPISDFGRQQYLELWSPLSLPTPAEQGHEWAAP